MPQFIPGNGQLRFPPGTTVEHNPPGGTWAMYINRRLNLTWLAYAVPRGTQITTLPGIRTRISVDFAGIQKFVAQRQYTACAQCPG